MWSKRRGWEGDMREALNAALRVRPEEEIEGLG